MLDADAERFQGLDDRTKWTLMGSGIAIKMNDPLCHRGNWRQKAHHRSGIAHIYAGRSIELPRSNGEVAVLGSLNPNPDRL